MPEVTLLLEFLENAGLVRGSRINEARIRRLSVSRLSDIGEQAASITRAEALEPAIGNMTHAATLSLGGGAQGCSNVACRMQRINQLAQFAAFYSDRVYIENFISAHQHETDDGDAASTSWRPRRLLDDLKVLMRVRPLIEAGLVVPVTISDDVCVQCIALDAFGISADKRFARERKHLASRFLDEMTVALEYHGEEWVFAHEAPEELLQHGGLYFWCSDLPSALAEMQRLVDRAIAGQTVKLSKAAVRKIGAHEGLARLVFDNVVFEMAMSQILRTAYLSDSELPLQLLTAISGDPDLARRNSVVQRHLTSMVPFLGDVSPGVALKLRRREEESFLTYRQALNTAIDNVRAEGSTLRERDAQAIYSDVIAPELARLDHAVQTARRDLLKNLARSAGAWIGAISFGMYSGLLPAQLVGAAQVLGLTKVLADLAQTALRLGSAGDTIRNQDLYFLWRVRHASQRRSGILTGRRDRSQKGPETWVTVTGVVAVYQRPLRCADDVRATARV
jgi:hypothetical protein